MRELHLWSYLLVGALFSAVCAMNNCERSCDLSLNDSVSVLEFCFSEHKATENFTNFTLAENGSIIFKPLPQAGQVSVEVNKNMYETKGFGLANLANSFVNFVKSGSLPYSE